MITAQKPDILPTIRAEGLELKQRGRYHWACCPFHNEKTASLKIDMERQSFYCFGCQAHGDIIEFVMRYKNLLFLDALTYLGINTDRPSPEALQAIKRQREKAEIVRRFRQWSANYHETLCDLYRGLQTAKGKVKTMADAELLAWAYRSEPLWEYRLDILEGRDDAAKYELYKEVKENEKGI